MLDVYKNIKKRRTDLGLSQTELAKRVGYADKTMISKIERGDVDLPQSKILAFANALGCTPGELMGWNDSDSEYYSNNETAQIAQEIFEDPDLHALFDAAKDSKPEDLKMAANMLKRFKETNPDG